MPVELKPKTALDIEIEFLSGLRTSQELVAAKIAAVRKQYTEEYVPAVQNVGGTPKSEEEVLSTLLGFKLRLDGGTRSKSAAATGAKLPLKYAFRRKDTKAEVVGPNGEQYRYAKQKAKIVNPALMVLIGKGIKNVEMYDIETNEALPLTVEFSANMAV